MATLTRIAGSICNSRPIEQVREGVLARIDDTQGFLGMVKPDTSPARLLAICLEAQKALDLATVGAQNLLDREVGRGG